jgi:CYTH domain-containing protein
MVRAEDSECLPLERFTMPTDMLPKYARLEIERRWLVMPESIGQLDGMAYRTVEDVYLPDTGLRLRAMREPSGTAVFKLCKKYGKSSALSEAMTNLYLSEVEHALLRSSFHGVAVRKRRYAVDGGSIDVYPGRDEWSVFEMEFESEAEALDYEPPGFVTVEITGDPLYSGAALASRLSHTP